MCEYTFRNGERCKEEAMPNSEYCILHVDLPEDEESEEFKRINELKEEKVEEKIRKGDFNFEGAKLLKIDIYMMEIVGNVNFDDVVILKDASFNGVVIRGYASFNGAKIGRSAYFTGAKICRYASFDGVVIGGHASFMEAEIGGHASFDGVEMGGYASFDLTEIKGVCSFKDAKFKKPQAQEVACRTARKTQERIGDRVSADYHFYREMEAKRKQKYKMFSLTPILKLIRKLRLEKLIDKHKEFFEKERHIYRGFLELPIQYIFGYGVHPWRVITTWLVTVFVLAFVYWLGHGVVAADSFWECLYFSIVTAATPGYGGYTPAPGLYQGLASFEAIFGTFMWATFIVTFARKYMR